MNFIKKYIKKDNLTSFSISILIHGILLILFIVIKIHSSPSNISQYTNLQIVEVPIAKSQTKIKTEVTQVNKNVEHTVKKEQVNFEKQNIAEKVQALVDTNKQAREITIPANVLADSTNADLKFASSLLDTLLILHPEYSSVILKQEAKNLVWNTKTNKFTRLALEKRINDEIHKYLKEKFPEGSEHALNPYTGPGLQIPIDGLIDKIRDIFK